MLDKWKARRSTTSAQLLNPSSSSEKDIIGWCEWPITFTALSWRDGANELIASSKLQTHKILQPNATVAHNGMKTLSLHSFSTLSWCSEGFRLDCQHCVLVPPQISLCNNHYSQCDTEKASHKHRANVLQTSNMSPVVHLLPWRIVVNTSWKHAASTWNRASRQNRQMFYKWKGTGRKCHFNLKQYWHKIFCIVLCLFYKVSVSSHKYVQHLFLWFCSNVTPSSKKNWVWQFSGKCKRNVLA